MMAERISLDSSLLDPHKGVLTRIDLGDTLPTDEQSEAEGVQIPGRIDVEALERRKAVTDQRRRNSELLAIGEALGGNFKAEEGLDDKALIADLSRSQTFEEKQLKFRDTFPEGDLGVLQIPTGKQIFVFRKNRDEPFRELVPDEDVQGKFAEFGGIVASAPVILGGAGTLIAGPVGTAVGTALGVGIDEAIEQARGFGRETPGAVATRAVEEGVIAASFDLATLGLIKVGRGVVSGKPGLVFEPTQEAGRAIEAANELGIKALTVGQVARSPTVRGLFFQVGSTSPIVGEALQAQEIALLNRIRAETARGFEGLNPIELERVLAVQRKELDSILPTRLVRRTDTSKSFQEGVETFNKLGRTKRDRLYDAAFEKADDVSFDVSGAKELGKALDEGVVGKAAKGAKADVVKTIKYRDPVTLQNLTVKLKGVKLSGPLSPEIRAVLDDLSKLDPIVRKFGPPGEEITAFEQIKTMRSRLFDLMQSSDGQDRRVATQLWGMLKDTMDNPILANPNNKAFVAAHRRASLWNSFYEKQKSKDVVKKLLAADETSLDQLAARYLTPGNTLELRMIKRFIPPENFQVLKEQFKASLQATPETISRRLDEWRARDPQGLRLIMTPAEDTAIRAYGKTIEQLKSGGVARALNQDLDAAQQAINLVRRGSTKQFADALNAAGGPNSQFGLSLKAGIYQQVLNTATEINKRGVRVLNTKAAAREFKRLRKLGDGRLNELFSPEELRKFENFEIYTAVASQGGDVGGPMQAGAVRGALARGIFQPLAALGAVRTITSNAIIARILASPTASKVLEQAFELTLSTKRIRAMISASVIAVQEAENQNVNQFETNVGRR